jgi:hypothetical protein
MYPLDPRDMAGLIFNRIFQSLRSKNEDLHRRAVELLKQVDGRLIRKLFLEAASSKYKPDHRARMLRAIWQSGVALDVASYLDLTVLLMDKNAEVRRAARDLLAGCDSDQVGLDNQASEGTAGVAAIEAVPGRSRRQPLS